MIDQIKKIMNEVNQICFDGKLTLTFPVVLNNTSRAAGQVSFNSCRLGMRPPFVTKLSISKNFKWTEKELRDVIAHELIHVYEIQVLKQRPGHGFAFKKEVNRINQIPGYLVQATHQMASTKEKKAVYALSQDNQKLILVSPSCSLREEVLMRLLGPNYKTGVVKTASLNRYRISSKVRGTYRMNQEKLTELGIMPNLMAA